MLKKILLFVLILFLAPLLFGFLFISFSPQFGGKPSPEQLREFEKLAHYSDGKFHNLQATEMGMDLAKAIKLLPEFFKNDPARKPDFDIPIVKIDSLELLNSSSTRLFWFGHSAFLLQIDGKNILLDPMFGEVPSPHPWLGNPRFFEELPIEIEELPVIDMILFSHDHYDHLDYESVKKLAGKTKQFAVPLGVGAHLEAWGIEKARITELDWWEDFKVQDISLIFTPSRHFSGRGLNNRFSTLWGSWVIIGEEEKLFFSGDGGYGPHFQEIGNRFGPFDFAMLECGQYNENWKEIHMMPEETALAALDLKAKEFMPIHWGAFSLAMHSWTDPVERVLAKSQELGLKIRVPKIGSMIEIKEESQPELYPWWINPDLVDLSDFQERKASIF